MSGSTFLKDLARNWVDLGLILDVNFHHEVLVTLLEIGETKEFGIDPKKNFFVYTKNDQRLMSSLFSLTTTSMMLYDPGSIPYPIYLTGFDTNQLSCDHYLIYKIPSYPVAFRIILKFLQSHLRSVESYSHLPHSFYRALWKTSNVGQMGDDGWMRKLLPSVKDEDWKEFSITWMPHLNTCSRYSWLNCTLDMQNASYFISTNKPIETTLRNTKLMKSQKDDSFLSYCLPWNLINSSYWPITTTVVKSQDKCLKTELDEILETKREDILEDFSDCFVNSDNSMQIRQLQNELKYLWGHRQYQHLPRVVCDWEEKWSEYNLEKVPFHWLCGRKDEPDSLIVTGAVFSLLVYLCDYIDQNKDERFLSSGCQLCGIDLKKRIGRHYISVEAAYVKIKDLLEQLTNDVGDKSNSFEADWINIQKSCPTCSGCLVIKAVVLSMITHFFNLDLEDNVKEIHHGNSKDFYVKKCNAIFPACNLVDKFDDACFALGNINVLLEIQRQPWTLASAHILPLNQQRNESLHIWTTTDKGIDATQRLLSRQSLFTYDKDLNSFWKDRFAHSFSSSNSMLIRPKKKRRQNKHWGQSDNFMLHFPNLLYDPASFPVLANVLGSNWSEVPLNLQPLERLWAIRVENESLSHRLNISAKTIKTDISKEYGYYGRPCKTIYRGSVTAKGSLRKHLVKENLRKQSKEAIVHAAVPEYLFVHSWPIVMKQMLSGKKELVLQAVCWIKSRIYSSHKDSRIDDFMFDFDLDKNMIPIYSMLPKLLSLMSAQYNCTMLDLLISPFRDAAVENRSVKRKFRFNKLDSTIYHFLETFINVKNETCYIPVDLVEEIQKVLRDKPHDIPDDILLPMKRLMDYLDYLISIRDQEKFSRDVSTSKSFFATQLNPIGGYLESYFVIANTLGKVNDRMYKSFNFDEDAANPTVEWKTSERRSLMARLTFLVQKLCWVDELQVMMPLPHVFYRLALSCNMEKYSKLIHLIFGINSRRYKTRDIGKQPYESPAHFELNPESKTCSSSPRKNRKLSKIQRVVSMNPGKPFIASKKVYQDKIIPTVLGYGIPSSQEQSTHNFPTDHTWEDILKERPETGDYYLADLADLLMGLETIVVFDTSLTKSNLLNLKNELCLADSISNMTNFYRGFLTPKLIKDFSKLTLSPEWKADWWMWIRNANINELPICLNNGTNYNRFDGENNNNWLSRNDVDVVWKSAWHSCQSDWSFSSHVIPGCRFFPPLYDSHPELMNVLLNETLPAGIHLTVVDFCEESPLNLPLLFNYENSLRKRLEVVNDEDDELGLGLGTMSINRQGFLETITSGLSDTKNLIKSGFNNSQF